MLLPNTATTSFPRSKMRWISGAISTGVVASACLAAWVAAEVLEPGLDAVGWTGALVVWARLLWAIKVEPLAAIAKGAVSPPPDQYAQATQAD